MPNFILHNEEYESGYLEGIQENLAFTSQAGFSGINVMSGAVRGDFEKETVFSGEITFNERDPAGSAVRDEERLDMLENIGVKVHYNTNRQRIPWADLKRSNFDSATYSNALGMKVAQSEMRHILRLAIKSFITATTAADPTLVYTSGADFTKTDLINIQRPLQDQAIDIVGLLTSRALAFDLVEEATVQNRYGEAGVVYGASAGSYDFPVLSTALDAMSLGTKQYILALFRDAITIKLDSNAPSIVIRDNDDTENHYQTWSLDGTFNLMLRNMPYVGAGGNVTETLLTTPANWGKTASITNLGGSIGIIGA